MFTLKYINVKMHAILELYHEFLSYHALLYMNVLSYGDFMYFVRVVLRDATYTLHNYDLGVFLCNAPNVP